jgi:hypothetical protein
MCGAVFLTDGLQEDGPSPRGFRKNINNLVTFYEFLK